MGSSLAPFMAEFAMDMIENKLKMIKLYKNSPDYLFNERQLRQNTKMKDDSINFANSSIERAIFQTFSMSHRK